MQNDAENLAHVLELEDEGSPSVSAQWQNQTSAPQKFILELLNKAELRAMMRQVAHQEDQCTHRSRVKERMLNAAEETLSNTIYIAFKSACNGLETASINFVKQIPTEIAQIGAQAKVLFAI